MIKSKIRKKKLDIKKKKNNKNIKFSFLKIFKEIKKNISKKINSVQTKKNKNLEKFFENSNSKAVIVRPDRFILSSCKSVKDFKSYLARNLFFLT